MRGATDGGAGGAPSTNISIHAPLAGCDSSSISCRSFFISFQSTHPLRGATSWARRARGIIGFQSTHPLRGATRQLCKRVDFSRISIHAPLAGCDTVKNTVNTTDFNFNPRTPCGVRHSRSPQTRNRVIFQSTHPLRGATVQNSLSARYADISIHAPLAGCDDSDYKCHRSNQYFNPRTPCGVRRRVSPSRVRRLTFQSTHPLRGATRRNRFTGSARHISIHAPLAGCDPKREIRITSVGNFNPRTPCGVRQSAPSGAIYAVVFQSTHPLRGATQSI